MPSGASSSRPRAPNRLPNAPEQEFTGEEKDVHKAHERFVRSVYDWEVAQSEFGHSSAALGYALRSKVTGKAADILNVMVEKGQRPTVKDILSHLEVFGEIGITTVTDDVKAFTQMVRDRREPVKPWLRDWQVARARAKRHGYILDENTGGAVLLSAANLASSLNTTVLSEVARTQRETGVTTGKIAPKLSLTLNAIELAAISDELQRESNQREATKAKEHKALVASVERKFGKGRGKGRDASRGRGGGGGDGGGGGGGARRPCTSCGKTHKGKCRAKRGRSPSRGPGARGRERTTRPGKGGGKGTKVCFDYAAGKCDRENCKFSHDADVVATYKRGNPHAMGGGDPSTVLAAGEKRGADGGQGKAKRRKTERADDSDY